MKRLFLLIVFISTCCFCEGQDTLKNDSLKFYTVNQLKSDFVFFRTVLEKAHPSLYRYEFKDTIDYYFNKALAKLDHPMDEIEYWKTLQMVVTKIGSGHTLLSFADETVKQANAKEHLVLPFSIYTENNRLFVKRSIQRYDSLLKVGSEILVINNVLGTSILEQLHNIVSGDGYSNSFKDYRIEGDFNRLYSLLYGESGQFLITYRYKGIVKTSLFKAMTVIPHFLNTARLSTVTYPADIPNTAILQVPNFTYEKEYFSLHETLFKDIKKHDIKNLVIDLRNNTGGLLKIASDMMKYFMTKDFKFTLANESVVNAVDFKHLANNTKKGTTTLRDFETLNRRLSRVVYSEEPTQYMRIGGFKGSVYLLINGGTFSAAVLFAAAVKQQRDCVIIGEEAGGGAAGCDGITFAEVILPNTRLKLRLPQFWMYAVNFKNDQGKGFMPDIAITPEMNEKYFPMGINPVSIVLKETIIAADKKTQ
jgi:hypothetical protein